MALPPSADMLKKLDKDLAKEAKEEELRVKHILKDLAKTEKAHTKTDKAVHHAGGVLSKTEKQETKAIKALNKATHDHDISVTKRHSAEQDVQMTQQQAAKVQKDLKIAKEKADAAVSEQQLHNRMREDKLADLHKTVDQQNNERLVPVNERVD